MASGTRRPCYANISTQLPVYFSITPYRGSSVRWVIYHRTRKRVSRYETALASPRVHRFHEMFAADLERRLGWSHFDFAAF
jgi:hypothetical protein